MQAFSVWGSSFELRSEHQGIVCQVTWDVYHADRAPWSMCSHAVVACVALNEIDVVRHT